MFSTPPAMNTSPSPALIACAALAAAWRPEPHSRFTVWPGTSTGSPARSKAIRATLRLSSPAWFVQPRITSSMERGSIPERSTIALMVIAARSSARTLASEPPCLPTGVRSAEQMYASLTVPRSAFRLRRSEAHPYRLELRIVVQRLAPQVSPEPRELVATERCRRVVKVVRIDPHGPRLDRACHAVRLLDVLGPDPGRQPVHRPVSELNPFGLVVERQHRQHRAEDLFIYDLHAGLGAVEHGGLDVVALAVHRGGFAARHEARAFFLPRRDVRQDGFLLALGHNGAEPRVLVERIAGRELPGPLRELLHDLIVHRLLHEQPRSRRADLALSIEDAVLGAAHRRREVGIGEDDVGALAAQLQRHPLHRRRGLAHDPLADFGRAREGDLVHERMAHQRGAGCGPLPRHHVERARRQARRDRDLPEQQGGERCLVRGLQDHRTPGREGGGDFPRGEVQGEVPRHDRAHHTHRLAQRVGEEVAARGVREAVSLGRGAPFVADEQVGLHRPLNSAMRFSTLAAIPSFASSLWNNCCCSSRSSARAVSKGISAPVWTDRLMRPTAFDALCGGQNCFAYRMTCSQNSFAGRISCTMPSSLARSNENSSPFAINSIARALPTSRASRWVPPVPGSTPRFTSGSPILPAFSLASRMSHAIAISSPPPTVWPFSAAIVSLGVCSKRLRVSLACRQKKNLKRGVTVLSIPMLAPAEKNLSPRPRSTITWTFSSNRARRIASSN